MAYNIKLVKFHAKCRRDKTVLTQQNVFFFCKNRHLMAVAACPRIARLFGGGEKYCKQYENE